MDGEGERRDSPQDVWVAVVGLDLPLACPRGRDDGRAVAGLAVEGDVEARRGVLEVVVPVRLLQDPLPVYICVRFAVRLQLQDGDAGTMGAYVLVVAAVVGVAGDGRLVLAAGEVEDGAALGVRNLVSFSVLDRHVRSC